MRWLPHSASGCKAGKRCQLRGTSSCVPAIVAVGGAWATAAAAVQALSWTPHTGATFPAPPVHAPLLRHPQDTRTWFQALPQRARALLPGYRQTCAQQTPASHSQSYAQHDRVRVSARRPLECDLHWSCVGDGLTAHDLLVLATSSLQLQPDLCCVQRQRQTLYSRVWQGEPTSSTRAHSVGATDQQQHTPLLCTPRWRWQQTDWQRATAGLQKMPPSCAVAGFSRRKTSPTLDQLRPRAERGHNDAVTAALSTVQLTNETVGAINAALPPELPTGFALQSQGLPGEAGHAQKPALCGVVCTS